LRIGVSRDLLIIPWFVAGVGGLFVVSSGQLALLELRAGAEGETVTLLNPRICDESADSDEQYEGYLSFFDVRGMVPRPLAIEVEHQDIDGTTRITTFERGMDRLVCHEVDHLFGLLYRSRMKPEVEPIPVSQRKGGGRQWTYR
jgi:peptide deformylase